MAVQAGHLSFDVGGAGRRQTIPVVRIGGLPITVIDRAKSAHLMIDIGLERRNSGLPPAIFKSANGQVLSLCARQSRIRVQALYPELVIVGHASGYFRREGDGEHIIEVLNATQPDILWLGLRTPIEQALSRRLRDRLRGVGVIKTSAGLFDYLSCKNAPVHASRGPGVGVPNVSRAAPPGRPISHDKPACFVPVAHAHLLDQRVESRSRLTQVIQ